MAVRLANVTCPSCVVSPRSTSSRMSFTPTQANGETTVTTTTNRNKDTNPSVPMPTDQKCDCCLVPRAEQARRANQGRRLVILVTGIRKGGLGYAICKLLALQGHIVIVAERDHEAGREAARDIRKHTGNIWFVHLDASDEERVMRLMGVIKRRWGRLDVVINNAGWAGSGPDNFLDLDAPGFRQLLEANLVSAFVITRAALRWFFLHQPEGGTCIYLGSTNGQPGNGNQLGYSSGKSALSCLVRCGVTQHGRHCRFLLVRPGLVETNSKGWEARRRKDPDYAAKEGQKIPLGRLARPEEIAAVIAFLLSPEASYLQGCEINVDGGLMASGNLLPGEASTSRDAYVTLVDLVNKAAAKTAA